MRMITWKWHRRRDRFHYLANMSLWVRGQHIGYLFRDGSIDEGWGFETDESACDETRPKDVMALVRNRVAETLAQKYAEVD